MKAKKLWKTSMLLLVGLTVLMTAVSVTATEDGETLAPAQRVDIKEDIAPEPDDIKDAPSDDEPDGSSWTPDYDPNVCIGMTSDEGEADSDDTNEDQTLMTAGLPVFGAAVAIGALAIAMILLKRKKIE